MDVYFVRHGQTDWNITWKIQGRTDIPINACGRAQAEKMATQLADVPFEKAYVSPLTRAQQTARILLAGRNVPVYTQPALIERDFGSFEGLRKEQFDFEAFWHPEVPCAAQNAETAGEFYARVQAFLRTLGGPGAVLLVAHGGVSIPVQMFTRNLGQSLGPDGVYTDMILPHGTIFRFSV